MSYYGKKKKASKSAAVYIVLALCLVAIGVATKAALNTLTDIEKSKGGTTINETSSGGKVNNVVSDIRYSQSETDKSSSKVADTNTVSVESGVTANTERDDVPKKPVASFFVMPVTGNILKGYSDSELQYSNTYNDFRLHTAVDIAADAGTAVKSAGDGTVLEIKNDPMLGTVVSIDHGNGVIFSYCGLSENPSVKAEDIVTSGTVLGSLSAIPCESVDASHLHLAVTKDGKNVSPLLIMGMEEKK